jgi:3-deoxy-7-phosphoheptulonate synthase
MPAYRLAARQPTADFDTRRAQSTVVRVGPIAVGGGELTVIAGPCAVENREMILATARAVRRAGALILRGGAYKPRTSPYAFRGLGDAALAMLAEARELTELAVVTEVMDASQLDGVMAVADILQVGARNMQNYSLLSAVGESGMPVVLKRGPSATITEFLLAAEYILALGNPNVILCERGIRTFETATRNTLDIAAVPVLKRETHLPVIVDPSHAGGRADLVESLSMAAVAAGADGLLIEVHPNPDEALSDGPQSLSCEQFAALMARLEPLALLCERPLRAQQPCESPTPARSRGSAQTLLGDAA